MQESIDFGLFYEREEEELEKLKNVFGELNVWWSMIDWFHNLNIIWMEGQGALNLIQKKNIQSEDIKEIVLLLNEPPFKENITLVGLDEMNTFDLGDLVFKIFKYLDSDININAKQTQPQEIIFQVTEFLKVLSYECEFTQDWENGLLNGDRKVIYPIYFFLLKNLNALKKRAYLAKFLVPLDIPVEFAGDPELKKLS